jgi:hypothetical protein
MEGNMEWVKRKKKDIKGGTTINGVLVARIQ